MHTEEQIAHALRDPAAIAAEAAYQRATRQANADALAERRASKAYDDAHAAYEISNRAACAAALAADQAHRAAIAAAVILYPAPAPAPRQFTRHEPATL